MKSIIHSWLITWLGKKLNFISNIKKFNERPIFINNIDYLYDYPNFSQLRTAESLMDSLQ